MKRTAAFILIALLCTLLIPAAYADEGGYVYDLADILSDSEEEALNSAAAAVSAEYGCAVYVAAVNDFYDYADEIETASTVFALQETPDIAASQDFVMLFLSMSNRKYDMMGYGDGELYFPSYVLDTLADSFLDNFADDDWYGGFSDFIDAAGSELAQGSSYDTDSLSYVSAPMITYFNGRNLLGAAILALVVALLVRHRLRKQMRSVAVQNEADNYIPSDGVTISFREDIYTHTTETRRKIESDNDHDSGSGSHSSGSF